MFTKSTIENYFIAQKSESLLFIIIGMIAILTSCVFFFALKTNVYKGMAISLLLFGLIQLSVGYSVYQSCDANRKKNTYSYDLNPSDLKNREIPRLEKMISNYVTFRRIGIILILSALVMVFMLRSNPERTFWYGMGIGLAIQTAILLGGGHFAQERAKSYLKGLMEFIK